MDPRYPQQQYYPQVPVQQSQPQNQQQQPATNPPRQRFSYESGYSVDQKSGPYVVPPSASAQAAEQGQDVANNGQPRFSWQETPSQVQNPTFAPRQTAQRRPTEPTIPQSPDSPTGPAPAYPEPTRSVAGQIQQGQQQSVYTQPQHTQPQIPQPQPQQPQYTYSYIPQTNAPAEPSSPGPLPVKHTYPEPTPIQPTTATSPTSPRTPYTPYADATLPVTKQKTPPIVPDTALPSTNPNAASTLPHLPGQIPHPNMSSNTSPHWTHSLCDPSDPALCCLGLLCPCILHSRTSHRLSQKSKHLDPTDMNGHSSCDSSCVLFAGLMCCGMQWLPAMLQRGKVRRMYGIRDGGVLGDCCKGCWCVWCVVVQGEREVGGREEVRGQFAGPSMSVGGGDAYGRERGAGAGGMVYAPGGGR